MLTELLFVFASLFILFYPLANLFAKKRTIWRLVLFNELELVLWIYVCFYIGWGLNYFRYDFYQRTSVARSVYNKERFERFLQNYTDSLNSFYHIKQQLTSQNVEQKVKKVYMRQKLDASLLMPPDGHFSKISVIDKLYASVGVVGYMGPFFCESYVNHRLSRLEYVFTYAHELSHLLGVSNEAEANFWAYLTCIHSDDSFVRLAGYWGLFPYVNRNAINILSEEDYTHWIKLLDKEFLAEYNSRMKYWHDIYSPLFGEVQNMVYEYFLKVNGISSGMKNYGEVIGLVLSLPDDYESLFL